MLAISTDSIYAHAVFKKTSPSLRNVTYPLVSDRNQEISRSYRVLDEKAGASLRASVIICPDQIIQAKLIYPGGIGRNVPEHLRLLQAFRYEKETGKGIPANWVPGQPGIEKKAIDIGKI